MGKIVIDNFIYEVTDGHAAFIGIDDVEKLSSALVIPPSITYEANDYIVGTIQDLTTSNYGDYSFIREKLKSIVIPDTVTSVRYGLFYGLENLQSIVFGEGVLRLEQCLAKCPMLCAIVCCDDLWFSQKHIGAHSIINKEDTIKFSKWYQLQPYGPVIIGVSLVGYKIPEGDVVNHIKIPEKIRYINEHAFDDCKNVQSIDLCNVEIIDCQLPDSVLQIEASGNALKELVSLENTQWYKVQEEGVLYIGKVCVGYKKNIVVEDDWELVNVDDVCDERERQNTFSLKEDTLSIVKGAFENCCIGSGFEILCNDSLKSIGDEAFYHSNLKAIALPSELESFGERCFADTNLHYVKIPDSIELIPNQAFEKCSLKEIDWGYGVKIIGESAFAHNFFERFKLPEYVEEIGKYAFYESGYYVNYLELPNSVKVIGKCAFYNWNLEHITFYNGALFSIEDCAFGADNGYGGPRIVEIPDSVKHLAHNAFSRCLHSEGGYDVDDHGSAYSYPPVTYYSREQVMTLIIGGGMESFDGLGKLKELRHVVLRDGIRNIGDYCFEGCESLVSIMFPSTLENIGFGTFFGCNKLEYLSFPKSIDKLFLASIPRYSKAIVMLSGQLTLYVTPDSKEKVEKLIENHVFKDSDGLEITPLLVFVEIKDGAEYPLCKDDFEIIENGCFKETCIDDMKEKEISDYQIDSNRPSSDCSDYDRDTFYALTDGQCGDYPGDHPKDY